MIYFTTEFDKFEVKMWLKISVRHKEIVKTIKK